jgi:hypothetical protein
MNKIEALKAQREELDKKIRDLAAKQSAADRKLKDRQKIIIGAWLMENNQDQVAKIVASLTRPQDKAAFAGFAVPKIDAPRLAATATA